MPTISSAVRTNLLSLQDISSQQSTVQNRLATGKKVNTALDNATSFFTASAFTNRAASLSALQESISTGVQTLQAANNGITAITSLVSQLRSTAQQALQSTSAYTAQASKTLSAITGATAADLRGAPGSSTASKAINTTNLTDTAAATNTSNLALSGATSGTTTVTIDDSTTSKTYTFDTTATASDATKFKDAADLNTKLKADGVKASVADSSGKLAVTATDTATTIKLSSNLADFWAASTTAGTVKTFTATAGDALTISDGTTSQTFTYDSTGKAANSFKDIDSLNSALAGKSIKATATDDGTGKLKLAASDVKTTLTVSGAAQGSTKLNLSASIKTAGLQDSTLRFSVGSGTDLKSVAVKFGDPADGTGAVKSLDDLNAKLSTVGLSASLDSSGAIKFTTTADTASKSFTVTADAAVGGLTANTAAASSTAVRGGTGADSRDSLVTQFNNLLSQIDSAAKDANFNGLNLLNGDTLSLIFNETNTSRLNVNGTSANFTGLGLSTVSATDFNDGGGINSVLTKIDAAKTSLATQASKFGSNLAVVQTRQTFTKNTVNTLNVGADNLVNADMNEEATNLLSLNTSQSLAQQALSLANQSNQSVLQLLR